MLDLCPLEPDWGNISEVVGALAAIAAAIAVAYFSRETNRLATEANITNQKIREMETSRDQQNLVLRRREQSIILAGLHYPIMSLLRAVTMIQTMTNVENFLQTLERDSNIKSVIASSLKSLRFDIPESTQQRLHFLDIGLARKIVAIHAHVLNLRDRGESMADRDSFMISLLAPIVVDSIAPLIADVNAVRVACEKAAKETEASISSTAG